MAGHHCAEREPSGFCWLNNVHIAIAHAAKEHGLTHAAILDFDLHHGDGSQAIAWSLNKLAASGTTSVKRTHGMHVPAIGYFSLHDINSYPCEYDDEEKIQGASINIAAHGQTIHNVHLKPYRTQVEFWELYRDRYSSIFRSAEEFLESAKTSRAAKSRGYRAGVFLSAGFDASEYESEGMQRHSVNVPTDFFAKFTADAVALADEHCEGRVVSVLEGGYSNRALTSGVFAHISGLSCVPPDQATYIPTTMYTTSAPSSERKVSWSSEWWALERIEELERLFPKPATEKRERRTTSFMDPTAASAARIAEAPRRSSSAFHSLSPSRAPSPPKPWEVQAYELSHFFIPSFEESKPIPALEKAKKPGPRQSLTGTAKELTMTLRDRKPRTAAGPAPIVGTKRRTSAVSESRTQSRATTPALNANSRAGTPALGGKPVTTAATGATVAGPRKVSATVTQSKPRPRTQTEPTTQEIAGQMAQFDIARSSPAVLAQSPSPPAPHVAKVPAKIILKFDHQQVELARQARLAQLEADSRQLESELQKARQHSGPRSGSGSNTGTGTNTRRRIEVRLPPPPPPPPQQDLAQLEANSRLEPELQKARQHSAPRSGSGGGTGTGAGARRRIGVRLPPPPPPPPQQEDPGSSGQNSMPSSPPMPVIEVNGNVPPEENLYPVYNASQSGNVLGHFHGVVVGAAAFKDQTFSGGDIHFARGP